MDVAYRNIIEIPEQSYHYFRHYFIPHEGNDHRPLAIRPKALKVYGVALLSVKLALAGFLYTVYPDQAHFAELTAGKIYQLTNASRQAAGVGTLKTNSQLTAAALAKGQDMLKGQYFEHTNPSGKKFYEWIQDAGYQYSTAGENLAMDFTTAESAQNALMASPSHRSNILKKAYVDVGMAVVQGEFQGRQTTILVEEFGAPPKAQQADQVAEAPAQVPATQPSVQGATTTTAATYTATIAGVSNATLQLLAGTSADVYVDYTNSGSADWSATGDHFVALNVSDPPGRTSAFADASWVATYRPARMETPTLRHGGTTRIRFRVHAPATAGQYNEHFALVAENLTWINGSDITLPITVTTAVATTTVPPTPTAPVVAAPTQPTDVPVVAAAPTQDAHPAESTFPLVVPRATLLPDWQTLAITWSIRFFWAFLIFLTAALVLHLALRAHVEHRHVIVLQTLAVIGLSATFALVPFHFAEHIVQTLLS